MSDTAKATAPFSRDDTLPLRGGIAEIFIDNEDLCGGKIAEITVHEPTQEGSEASQLVSIIFSLFVQRNGTLFEKLTRITGQEMTFHVDRVCRVGGNIVVLCENGTKTRVVMHPSAKYILSLLDRDKK